MRLIETGRVIGLFSILKARKRLGGDSNPSTLLYATRELVNSDSKFLAKKGGAINFLAFLRFSRLTVNEHKFYRVYNCNICI